MNSSVANFAAKGMLMPVFYLYSPQINTDSSLQGFVANKYTRMSGSNFASQAPIRLEGHRTIDSTTVNVTGKVIRTTVNTDLRAEFDLLVNQWTEETAFHSSLGEIFTNEAYQSIMAMGQAALPLILSELRKKPGHWFYALEKIARSDVAEGAKNFAEARALWLEWGYTNNYI